MKVASIVMAAAVALSMAPAASAQSVFDSNVSWILDNANEAGMPVDYNAVASVAMSAAERGINFATTYGSDVGIPIPPGADSHAGDGWAVCFAFFFGGGCIDTVKVASPVSAPAGCVLVPAHTYLYVYNPTVLVWSNTGADWTLYTWTESAALPLFHPGWNGTFVGAGCYLADLGFIVEFAGDGAWLD